MNHPHQLDPAWRRAFEEAQRSFHLGSFGVGAVLIADAGEVVATGRNMVATAPDDQSLGGNYLAHAEMNAFAAMSSYHARGLHLITTLEPCLMCAATALFLNVESIAYATRDEFFDGIDDLWLHHPYTRERHRPSIQPIGEPLASFARLLPLIHTLETVPERAAAATARTRRPDLAALADDLELVASLRNAEALDAAFELVRRRLG